MRNVFTRTTAIVALVAAAIGAVAATAFTRAPTQNSAHPRIDGKPNFSGIWQANNEANWDLQAHEALPASITQPGVYPYPYARVPAAAVDRKSTRLNSSHVSESRMPSSA